MIRALGPLLLVAAAGCASRLYDEGAADDAAVVVEDAAPSTVDAASAPDLARVAPTGPIWAMWGHDARRSFASPYVGPKQAPHVAWKATVVVGSLVIAGDGTVYAQIAGERFGAISPIDGSARGVDDDAIYDAALAPDGSLFLEPMPGSDIAVLRPDGSSSKIAAGSDVPLLVGPDGALYLARNGGAPYGLVTAIAPDGTTRWSTALADAHVVDLALGDDGLLRVSCAVPSTGTGVAVAIEATTGATRWRFAVASEIHPIALAPDGRGYFVAAAPSPLLTAVTPDGILDWQKPLTVVDVPPVPPAIDARLVLRVAGLAVVEAYDADDGDFDWGTATPGGGSGPVTVDATGVAYRATQRGVVALAPDGDELWAALTDHALDGQVYVAPGGRLYVLGASDGTLYALDP